MTGVSERLLCDLNRVLAGEEGIRANTPRESIKQAYQAMYIENEQTWLNMLHDRDEALHVYNRAMAAAIYERIRKHMPELDRAYKFLLEKYGPVP